jgi:hypothetical protein
MATRTYAQRINSLLGAIEGLGEDGATDLNSPEFDDHLNAATDALEKARDIALKEEGS